MTALPHPDYISQASTRSVRPLTISARFGDGDSQEVPDGINSQLPTWQIAYQSIPTEIRDDIIAALEEVGCSGILSWTPPYGAPAGIFKVTMEGWNESFTAGNLHDLSFSLREVK